MKKVLFFALALISAVAVNAQSPVGRWKTIDDETNQPKSEIEIYEQNGKLYGKVVKFLRPGADPERICTACTDWRKGQKIMNMVIVRDMQLVDGYYQGGKILDPEKGKEYSCKMWLVGGNPNEMEVRGFLGISALGRTQKWYRIK